MTWLKFDTIRPERPFDQALVAFMEISANHGTQLRSMHGALIAMARALATDAHSPTVAEALARLAEAEVVMAEYEVKSLGAIEDLASKLQAAVQPRPPA